MAKLTDLPAELIRIIVEQVQRYSPRREHSKYQANYETLPGVTWPEGLPSNPLVVLSLVCPTLRRCAQEMLFREVKLESPWEAYLFLTALKGNHGVHKNGTRLGRLSAIDTTCLNTPARHVRSLNFKLWPDRLLGKPGCSSNGKGGGSAVCGVLRNCPLLESIIIDTAFFSRCKEPIMEALASKQLIKQFTILKNDSTSPLELQWLVDEMDDRLFSRWDMLEEVELAGLSSRSFKTLANIHNPKPVLNRALQRITLTDFDLDETELYSLLTSSRKSIRTLEIVEPSPRLDRMGLFRILRDCASPDLKVLWINLDERWHPLPKPLGADGLDDPARNPYLCDILFVSSFRKLQSLFIDGYMASPKFLTLLPQSIVDFEWRCCSYEAVQFAAEVFNWRNNADKIDPPPEPPKGFEGRGPWLPNLESFIMEDYYSHYRFM
ncbi:hypothetical protein PGT21_036301 [Puccinia graminis f. sp. tritici]|uniref:F-box domain-containing protein n=1 Tax=Puccinia graminis f. sp. tritici TaxID=56615 RepID=A0A5B0Q074_PUCGR|nr:hypothetical protein PGT21_036301 [Puccinia graminis f. sp. tritici]KAA1126230.1 hypothetical protein PGTUg99_016831 [Puccinia graminis f. sp. tritici]